MRLCQRCSVVLPPCFCKVQPHTKKAHASLRAASFLSPSHCLAPTKSFGQEPLKLQILDAGRGQIYRRPARNSSLILMSCVDREEGGGEKGCVPVDRDKTATRRLSSYQSSKRSVNAACFGRPNSRRGSWQNPPLPPLIWVQPFRAAPDAGCHEAALPPLLAHRGATGSRPSARTRCAALPPALLGRGLPPAGTAGAACSPATACCPGQQSTPSPAGRAVHRERS